MANLPGPSQARLPQEIIKSFGYKFHEPMYQNDHKYSMFCLNRKTVETDSIMSLRKE